MIEIKLLFRDHQLYECQSYHGKFRKRKINFDELLTLITEEHLLTSASGYYPVIIRII